MFCPKCGRELQDGARFCGGCGASVGEPSQVQAPSAQSAPASQAPASQPAQPQTPPQAAKPSVDVKAKISNMQGKLDNSNSKFLKGRSIWDVVGLCAVALLFIGIFLPFVSGWSSLEGSRCQTLFEIAAHGTKPYSSTMFLVYVSLLVFFVLDLLVTKENAIRHVKLILTALIEMLFVQRFNMIGTDTVYMSTCHDVGSGFGSYITLIALLVIIVVGIIGIVEKKKGKIAG